MTPEPAVYYAIADDVKAFRVSDDGILLFGADRGETTNLNETGGVVWSGLTAGSSLDEIAELLASTYDGCTLETAQTDVADLARDLARKGFVTPSAARPGATPGVPLDVAEGPSSLDVAITGACNARCLYCAYSDEMERRHDLPSSEWQTFFAELVPLRVRSICLSGGESFARRDLFDVIDGLIERRMRYSILSNGQLITERTVQSLCSGRRATRLDSIQISIDGSCAAVHDRTRGAGAFDQALRGLRLLLEARLPVTCRVTISRHNADDLERVAHLLLDELGVRTISTNSAMPQGRGGCLRDDVCLTREQLPRVMSEIARLADLHGGRIVATAGPLAEHRAFARMRESKAGRAPRAPYAGRLSSCGCVFDKLAILHDGTIVACMQLPDIRLGRINRDSLRDIWKHAPPLRALRERQRIPMSAVPGCGDCEWADLCNGGCPALAYTLTGEINRANPEDCYRAFLDAGDHAGS